MLSYSSDSYKDIDNLYKKQEFTIYTVKMKLEMPLHAD